MAGTKKVARVRALRHLVAFDDDVTVHIVPKGMTGTLRGTDPGTSEGKTKHSFVVAWDFHAIGDSSPTRDECEPGCCDPGFDSTEVPLDAIEFIGTAEEEADDDEPAAVEADDQEVE